MWSLIRCPYLRNAVCGIQFSSVQFMCVESTMWGFHARRAGPRDIRIMAYIARRQHTGTVLQQYTFRPHTNYVVGSQNYTFRSKKSIFRGSFSNKPLSPKNPFLSRNDQIARVTVRHRSRARAYREISGCICTV